MTAPSAPPGEPGPRKVAFLVAEWSHPTTVLSWAWLRKDFLRVRRAAPAPAPAPARPAPLGACPRRRRRRPPLSLTARPPAPPRPPPPQRDKDELVIVHAGREAGDAWKAAGPLGPGLDAALAGWPHTVESLAGRLPAGLAAFLRARAVDVVVLDEDLPAQGGLSALVQGSPSEWVKANVHVPFVIVRPSAVRNARLRLAPDVPPEGGSPGAGRPRSRSGAGSPEGAGGAGPAGRRVAIAYPSAVVGRRLLERARVLVLSPHDEVFVVHAVRDGAPALIRRSTTALSASLRRKLALGGGGERGERGDGAAAAAAAADSAAAADTAPLGAAELAGFNAHLNVTLKGDPRAAVASFCESADIELLIISTRTGSRLRKTLTGGSISGALIDRAPCPCFVVPFRALGLSPAEEEEAAGAGAASFSPRGSGAAVAAAAAAAELGAAAAAPPALSSRPSSAGALDAAAAAAQVEALCAQVAAKDAQVAAKDAVIAELRAEVEALRLAAAAAQGS
jgi:nucleotide-binding universal stress UspA family protein